MTTAEYCEVPVSEPRLVWGVVFSSLLHLVLILLLIGVPGFSSPKRTYFSSAYMVKLVDMPGMRPGSPGGAKSGGGKEGGAAVTTVKEEKAEKKVEVTKAEIKKEGKTETQKQEIKKVEEKKGVTLTEKKKEEKEGVKKEGMSKAEKVPKEAKGKGDEEQYRVALNKIREKVELKQMRERVEQIRGKIAEGEGEGEGAGVGEGGGFGLGSGEGSGMTGGPWGIPFGRGMIANLPLNYQLYYQAIEQKIKANWNLALPRGVLEDMKGMEVVLSIKIRADGEIVETAFEKKSGNIYLDESAFRAVKKSSPLPPFADYNIREPFFETGIIFPAGELL